MSRVIKSVILAAEPTRVIDYIAGVTSHPAFIPALKILRLKPVDAMRDGA